MTDPAELPGGPGPQTSAKAAEVKAARQLVRALSGDFDIKGYRDEYRELVLELIEKKAKGRKIARPKKAAEKKPVPDLMAALEESLNDLSGGSKRKVGPRTPSARKRGSAGTHKSKAH